MQPEWHTTLIPAILQLWKLRTTNHGPLRRMMANFNSYNYNYVSRHEIEWKNEPFDVCGNHSYNFPGNEDTMKRVFRKLWRIVDHVAVISFLAARRLNGLLGTRAMFSLEARSILVPSWIGAGFLFSVLQRPCLRCAPGLGVIATGGIGWELARHWLGQ